VGNSRRADLGPLLALFGLVLAVFAGVVFGGRVFFERDVGLMWHGQADALARVVRAGSWPTWNPYHSFGVPLLANPNAQVFYPLTWLSLVMRPESYYSLYVVLHVLLSATGLYLLARRFELSRVGAFVAAAVWILSGPSLSLVQLWNHLAGAAWLPWTLLAADAALASGKPAPALAWGLAMAAQVFAGAPEMLLAGVLLAVGLALRHLVRRAPARVRVRRVVGVTALATCAGLGFAAAQWLPTLSAAWQTPRLALPEALRTFWSVHPLRALEIVLPLGLDRLQLPDVTRAALLESREGFLRSLYCGLPAALLACAALATRRRRAWALGLVGLAATVVAFGRHTSVYGLAVAALPVLRAFRYPEKAMIVAAFALALLAGMGLDATRGGTLSSRLKVGLVVPGALLVLAALLAGLVGLGVLPVGAAGRWGGTPLSAILGPASASLLLSAALGAAALALQFRFAKRRAGRVGAAALALMVTADLLAAHRDLNPTAPSDVFSLQSSALDVLRVEDHSRLYVFDYTLPGRSERYLGHGGGFLLADGPPASWRGVAAARAYLHPFTLASFGLEGSYAADTIVLYPSHLDLLTRAVFDAEETDAELRLLRAGAVSRVVSLHVRGFESLIPIGVQRSLFREPMRLFRVPDPLPRAYVVGTVQVGSDDDALRFLTDPARDLRATVVAPEGPASQAPAWFSGHVAIESWKADRVRLAVVASGPATAVLVDTFDPGWTVTVDGKPAVARRVNVSFRGVDVPAGGHEVEWLYRPPAIIAGACISGAALLAAAAFVSLSPVSPLRAFGARAAVSRSRSAP
jgi:hypothetical protein